MLDVLLKVLIRNYECEEQPHHLLSVGQERISMNNERINKKRGMDDELFYC